MPRRCGRASTTSQTNKPIYSGRDGIIKERLEDIEYERRTGYAWVGDWPRALVEVEYPRYREGSK